MSYCPVCQSIEYLEFTGEERMFGFGDRFDYCQCQKCGGIWIKEIPKNLSKYYPDKYYAFGKITFDNPLVIFLKKLRYSFFKAGISIQSPPYFEWLKNLKVNENSKIADIGCGNGIILRQMRACGFRNLFGFDPFISQEILEKNLTIRKIAFEEISGKFDVIMFHHSLEHMDNPSAVFQRLNQLLNPNGKVIIRVPVADATVWEMEGSYWFQLDAPRHLFIPHTRSIAYLADKNNLEVEKVIFDSEDKQFIITELYKRGIPLIKQNKNKAFSKTELQGFVEKANYLNHLSKGDQAAFYLKKNLK